MEWMALMLTVVCYTVYKIIDRIWNTGDDKDEHREKTRKANKHNNRHYRRLSKTD